MTHVGVAKLTCDTITVISNGTKDANLDIYKC